MNCSEAVQMCPDDRELYCGCGHAAVNRCQFRCHGEAHGDQFAQFTDKMERQLDELLSSKRRRGNRQFTAIL